MYQKFAIIALVASTEALKLECGPCCGGGSDKDDEEVREELIEETFDVTPVASAIVAEVLDSNPETWGQVEETIEEVHLPEFEIQEDFIEAIVEEEITEEVLDEIILENERLKQLIESQEEQAAPQEEQVALLAQAVLWDTADCSGYNTFEFNFYSDQDVSRTDYPTLDSKGWNDKGQAVKVPLGYQLDLWVDANHGGKKFEFFGKADEDGHLLCQDLGELRNQMSDSEFYPSEAQPEPVEAAAPEPIVEAAAPEEPVEEEKAWLDQAVLFTNADCTGETFEWDLFEGDNSLRIDYPTIDSMGWNDRGQSVMVPPGFKLELWVDARFGGDKFEFFGQANEDGTLVCQDLGDLRNQMSDSIFSISDEPVVADAADIVDSTAAVFTNADCTGDKYEWTLADGEDSLSIDYPTINSDGWNDKGQSVMVPPGFQLDLWQHAWQGGRKLEFAGQADENGQPVCQDLGELRNQMSDSRFFRN